MNRSYADWKAPRQDAANLIWPVPATIARATSDNARVLTSASRVLIQNVPLPELRAASRKFVGHDDDRFLIATGHQAELYHPGVWAKNAMIHALAKRLGGVALHVSVDTDSPKHLAVRWPGGALPVTDDPALVTAKWTGLINGPSPTHVGDLETAFEAAAGGWGFRPASGAVFDSLRRSSLDPTPLPNALLAACHELDWSLGLRYSALTLSPVLQSDAYLALAHHIAARAAEFATAYNRALAAYRFEQKIQSSTRPMPDLEVAPDKIELPFWLDDLTEGARERAAVHRAGTGWQLRFKNEAFDFDPTLDAYAAASKLRVFLRTGQRRLGPRALTLTLFMRLLLADQFVHGIGGGRYDQITDRLIASHFGLAAPAFSVTTATMFFPAAGTAERACVPCLLTEGHRLRHNLLGDTKRPLLAAVNAARRLSAERKRNYLSMHHALAAASAGSTLMDDWKRRLDVGRRQHQEELVLHDRELFYALQPVERLTALVERYDDALGGR